MADKNIPINEQVKKNSIRHTFTITKTKTYDINADAAAHLNGDPFLQDGYTPKRIISVIPLIKSDDVYTSLFDSDTHWYIRKFNETGGGDNSGIISLDFDGHEWSIKTTNVTGHIKSHSVTIEWEKEITV